MGVQGKADGGASISRLSRQKGDWLVNFEIARDGIKPVEFYGVTEQRTSRPVPSIKAKEKVG